MFPCTSTIFIFYNCCFFLYVSSSTEAVGCFFGTCSTLTDAFPDSQIDFNTVLNGLSAVKKPYNKLPSLIQVSITRSNLSLVSLFGTNTYGFGYSPPSNIPLVQAGPSFADEYGNLNVIYSVSRPGFYHPSTTVSNQSLGLLQLISYPTQKNGSIISPDLFIIHMSFVRSAQLGDIYTPFFDNKLLHLNKIPSISSSHVIFRLRFDFPSSNPGGIYTGDTIATTMIIDSTPFAIVSACKLYTKTILGYDDINAWTDNCNNRGTCQSNGICRCVDGYSGPDCAIASPLVVKCDSILNYCGSHGSCDFQMNKCDCTTGWTGVKCQTKIECQSIGTTACSNHGHFITDPTTETCTDGKCECNDAWVGSSCQSCGMQCKNSGRALKSCDGPCGCQAGFSGYFCTCSQRQGSFTIAMNNDVVQYVNKVRQEYATSHNIINPFQIYAIDLSQISDLSNDVIDTYNLIADNIAAEAANMLGFMVQPSATLQIAFDTIEHRDETDPTFVYITTRVIFTMKYNCDVGNSIDLDAAWGKDFIPAIPTDLFKQYFTPTNKNISPTDIENPKPNPSTIDDDHVTDENHSYYLFSAHVSIFFVSLSALFFFN